jgi:hypothetical protein
VVEQLIAKRLRRIRRGSVFHERKVGDLLLMLNGWRRVKLYGHD